MSFPRYSVCSCFAGIKEILIQQLFCRPCSVPVYDEGRQLEGRTVLDRYDKAVAELEKTEAKFDEDVMNYNQKLAQYNVGKDAVSSGKTAYNEGKAQLDAGWDAYNEGSEQLKNYDKAKAQYDESLAAYNKLTKAISDLEAKGVPHRVALAMVSVSAGQRITDDSLAEMKSQLDSAKKQLDTAKKQLDQAAKAKEQLKDAKSQLAAGEKQISELEKEISGGQGKLNEQQKAISDKRTELEKTKADLDARSEKLEAYEDTSEKAQRSRDNLIDEGYGTEEDDNAAILSAAQKHEDKLHGEYLKASISYSVTNITRLLAIVSAVIALLKLRKNKLKPATKLAIAATAFGAVSLIASIVFGSVHSLAFAAAVFTAVGVCLTEKPEEA
ncbi:MAG: hypothetical protein BHW36_09390 [Firmicutes bacterium CAG:24053_14]|jgi:chromosome segregation ATPase|nr:MAG: hypothetical protein BHW36_09390 [Firmicutes bacterium CAG:24053_14]